jgi:sugar phosphate isomerase/epimerase
MKFGICCGPSAFGGDNVPDSVARLNDALEAAGADYVEFGVGITVPEGDEAEFEALRSALANHRIKPEAFNGFIPGSHRITGPEVDFARLMNYATIALTRCKALGGEVVVLGSGKARATPEGFDPAKAEQQFIEFCREVGPVAQSTSITIAIEPLNTKEDNLVNTVEHGARIVDAVAHPNIQLLADLYHIAEDKEPLENVRNAGSRLVHTHLADIGRVAPGYAGNGEEDFVGFFKALRAAGYDSRCSFEGKFEDIGTQVKPALDLMKQRWSESA